MSEKQPSSSTFEELRKAQQHGNRKVGLGFKGSKVKQHKKIDKARLVDGKKPKDDAPERSRPAPPSEPNESKSTMIQPKKTKQIHR